MLAVPNNTGGGIKLAVNRLTLCCALLMLFTGKGTGQGAPAVAIRSGQSNPVVAPPVQTPSEAPGPPSEPRAPQGVVLDRVVAVVNDDLILESDVDEERRFEEIQPYRDARAGSSPSRGRAIERLVDRTLISQQATTEPETAVSDTELDAQLARLRKDIPACKQEDCQSDSGWARFLGQHGFTVQEFRERWRKRMILLRFIEVRFRNGVHISDEEIKAYYDKTMLPQYTKRHVTAPPLDSISKRIEEVLLQQEVGALLVDWLRSLRAQGSVKLMTSGEVTP
ncbi:MAG: SurA N-terminal domain-containing protein [Acidobacteriota bacterium]|nr:SurA N-terminal domain-containing protein [Acidobacteriota bacterium]